MSNEFKLVPALADDEIQFAIEEAISLGYPAADIWSTAEAAAHQTPATELVAAGLDMQQIVTEALIGMIAAVTSTSPPANEPPPPFIQAGIDRAVSRISAHLAPLQAEIGGLRCEVSKWRGTAGRLTHERDQLKARCDELEHRAADVVEGFDGEELPGAMNMRIRKLKNALSKPAGSEQV